jgi:hypothetical protein
MTDTLNPADANSWYDWVTNFDQTYQQFQTNWNALLAQSDYVSSTHPELLATYNDLIARGQGHSDTLTQLKATRDYVASWLSWLSTGVQSGIDFVTSSAQSAYDAAKAALGLSGIPRAIYRQRRGMGGLGIAPLVVIGVAAAAAALVIIGLWIKDAYNFSQRLAALQAQEAALAGPSGIVTPQIASQAQSIVDGTLGPAPGSAASINDNLLGIPWTWIIAGAVLVFVGPPLLKTIGDRGNRG